jgi:hypothetical protein
MDPNLFDQGGKNDMNELPQPILQMIVLQADDRTKARMSQTNSQWRQFCQPTFSPSCRRAEFNWHANWTGHSAAVAIVVLHQGARHSGPRV